MTEASTERTFHILVVDDDDRIRKLLCSYLAEEGFSVSAAGDGRAMRAQMAAAQPDLVLLDLVMPGDSGLDLVKELRRAERPVGIIMITGRSDTIDTVVGLEMGADDYIAKPFHLREVSARIKSVLRRLHAGHEPAQRLDDVAIFEGWELDFERRTLTAPDGSPVPLTTGEFVLLRAFVQNAGRVLDRNRLMDLTRGRDWHAYDRSIDAQVARLRRRIEPDPRNPALIKSVRGVGYTLTARVICRGGAA